MASDEAMEKGALISEMLGEYFDVEPEAIQGYLIGIERTTDDGQGLMFSSIWSMNKPMWQLLGFADELKAHVERQRGSGDELPLNGQPQQPSRQVRRARARTRGKRAS